MDRLIQYPAQIPLVEDMLNAQRNAMVGVGHLAGATFGANTVAASGFACAPGEGLTLTIAPGALLAPGVVDASAYGTLAAVSSALVRQFISRDPVTLAAPAAGATYIVSVTPLTVDTDDTVLPFYNAADPSVTYAGEGNSGLAAPTVRRDESVLSIGTAVPAGAYPLWQIVIPAGSAAITTNMISVAPGAPFYPTLASVASRIVAPFNAQLAVAMGGYPLNAVVADPAAPGTFWVSTADANVSIPGADGATWQSLFNGYASQAWANGQFLQLANAATQTVTGPVTFSGITTVPTPTDYAENQAIGASDADARYARLSGGNAFSGNQNIKGVLSVGTGAGWSGGTTSGASRWSSSHLLFGAPDGTDGVFQGGFQITDTVGDSAASNSNYPGINMFGFNYEGKRFDWYFSWNGNIQTSKGDVAFTSELPTAGTITGGTYTKTPMNDGTGRSVLSQTFSASCTDGTAISFPMAFSETPTIQMTARHDASDARSVIPNESGSTLSATGVVVDLRSLTGGGGAGTASEGYTGTTEVYITVEGIVG